MNGKWDSKPELFVAFSEYLNPDKPRKSFERYLTERSEVHPELAYYQDHGSWRERGSLSDSAREEVLETVFNQGANNCYYNAQTAMIPERTYVEGYVITNGHVPAPHAWLEVEENGVQKVVEITPPWSEKDGQHTEYFGVPFDESTVRKILAERETADPIVEAVIRQVDEAGV